MSTLKIPSRWLRVLFSCYAWSLGLATAWGADPSADTAKPASTKTPAGTSDQDSKTVGNDKTNYVGDRVSFSRDMIVTVEAADQSVKGTICLPRKYLLRGGHAYSANGADGNSTPEAGTRFILIQAAKDPKIKKKPPGPPPCTNDLPDKTKVTLDQTLLEPGAVIRVKAQQLTDSPPDRLGMAFGVLTVPFKYHLTGAKDFTGSASLGSYLGYRTDNEGLGYGTTFLAFIGASNISVPEQSNSGSNTQGGSTTTHNLFGVSYGFGAVATIKGSFQAGLVIGADRVSNSEKYQYNGKPWLALELGYDFLQ